MKRAFIILNPAAGRGRGFGLERPLADAARSLGWDAVVRFTRRAGDEIDANNPEGVIATGFLRMGPWELTGMEVAKVARQRFLDDVTNSVGEAFLGHSLQCARCHDHKFDEISQADFARAARALALKARTKNDPACKMHLRRIQFPSMATVDKEKNAFTCCYGTY